MPLFWKKSEKFGLQRSASTASSQSGSLPGSPVKRPSHHSCNGDTSSLAGTSDNCSLDSVDSFGTREMEALLQGDLGASDRMLPPLPSKSRLSKTLEEVLHDHNALGYFIQYMNGLDRAHLVKFWLAAESFQASAFTRKQSHSLRTISHLTGDSNLPVLDRDKSLDCKQSHTDETALNASCDLNKTTKSHAGHENVKSTDSTKPQSINSTYNPVSSFSIDSKKCASHNSFTSHSVDSVLDLSNIHGSTDSGICERNDSGEKSRLKSNKTENGTPSKRMNNDVLEKSKELDISCIDGVELRNSRSHLGTTQKRVTFSEDINKTDEGLRSADKTKSSIEEDAVKIFTRYIAKDAANPIGITDMLRDEITKKICREDGNIDPECFVSAQQFVVNRFNTEYFPNFLRSDYHCKYQIDVLTSGRVHLHDILYNETALLYFMEFLEQEGKRPLLDMWIQVNNFWRHLLSQQGQYNPTHAQDDAMVIYDKYFSLQATCPLGFSDTIRFEVERNICQEEGPLPNCFETPTRIIFHLMEKSYFPHFLCSQIYFQYLSELISSINANHELPRRMRTDSESNNESGITNTLSSPSVRIIKNIRDHDMRIDSGQFDPDSLWKRPLSGKLSMGHVNDLGQFVPEFEPEPDKKESMESRITKVVKRIVIGEEDKAKEEMAWQVAEMIVKEVTNITLKDEPPHSPLRRFKTQPVSTQ